MKQLMLNDGRNVEVQSVSASAGVMHIRMILTTSEQIKAYFKDEFATSLMTLYENGKEQKKYENYTVLTYIKEESGGIWEVEMRQTAADTDTRLTELENTTGQQAAEIEQIKKEIAEGGAGVDQELFTASVVVARANAHALSDAQAIEAKVLYPQWKEIIGQTVKQGYKFLYENVLYKTIQDNLTIQEQYVPGEGTESLYAVIDETHAGTKDDPIPYTGNMALESGKYYSQDSVIYLCNRNTEIAVHQALSELVGIYVTVAE